jgi:hypothetical protein
MIAEESANVISTHSAMAPIPILMFAAVMYSVLFVTISLEGLKVVVSRAAYVFDNAKHGKHRQKCRLPKSQENHGLDRE